ncbi:MAG TPA: hypothetical protein VNA16_04845 [Abditibacteriaceae bacterium]|nr:hypothetical protein [Abditibacteriaceae bacterium]
MQIRNKTLRLVLSAAVLTTVAYSVPASAATYVVKNTNDSGLGSLRHRITMANSNPGLDTIAFNIPGAGVHTIAIASALPAITSPVIIDGYSQPRSAANTLSDGDNAVLLIELSGANAPPGTIALSIIAGRSVVRGLVINRFGPRPPFFGYGIGIFISGKGGNTVEGCFIGTNPSGSLASPNEYGLLIAGSPNNMVGGATVGSRNVISGNLQGGVRIADYFVRGSGNQIRGNYIGTASDGQRAVGNDTGVLIEHGSNNIVGGTLAEERNIISGNSTGVLVYGDQSSVASGHKIQGNYIGANVTGTQAIGNEIGIRMDSEGMNNMIGGTTVGARNVISGNGSGILLSGSTVSKTRVKVQGNYIGADVTGTVALGNTSFGIFVNTVSLNRIGGAEPGAGNLIAFNASGVYILGGASGDNSYGISNAVLANSIHSNTFLGIDLNDFGPGANDEGDSDTGGNKRQNYPGLYSAVSSSTGSSLAIRGLLRSAPSTAFRIEFFASPSCDPSGYGEGKTFLGARKVMTGPEGKTPFLATLPTFVAAGQVITATATDPDGNTSEFSACVPVTSAPSTTAVVARADSAGANG